MAFAIPKVVLGLGLSMDGHAKLSDGTGSETEKEKTPMEGAGLKVEDQKDKAG